MEQLMEDRELLVLFKMLRNEERQRIIQALLSADNEGLILTINASVTRIDTNKVKLSRALLSMNHEANPQNSISLISAHRTEHSFPQA